MDELRFSLKAWEALGRDELYALLHLRDLVFVVGQGITAEPEVDGRDPQCHHAALWEGTRPVATARLFMEEDPVVVGRVAVHPERQRGGIGTRLMEAVQEALGARRATLHAQAHLEDWYARLGWVREGEVFVEAEIPHVHMNWAGGFRAP